MDLSQLEIMRYKIRHEKEFSRIFEYFFDNFGEDPEFIAASEPGSDDLLLKLLGQVCGAMFKTDKVRLDNLRLLRVPSRHFLHGGFTINGCMANVIYCDDIRWGVLVVHRPRVDPPTHFARFSAEMLPPGLLDNSLPKH